MAYIEDTQHREAQIDEIPNVNTELHFRKTYKVTSSGRFNYIENLDKLTGTSDINEQTAILNREYPDLAIRLTDFDGLTLVDIKHRPSEYNTEQFNIDIDTSFTKDKNNIYFLEALQRLQDYTGIQMQIAPDNLPSNINVQQAGAFIYNGTIYINPNNASIQDPIHELLHLFLGSARYNNTQLYTQLVTSVEQLSDYNDRAKYYPNRTRLDVDEEIFVEELAKYVTGQDSILKQLPSGQVNTLMYNIKRDIDTIIDGKYSSKSMNITELFNSSILDLSKLLQSDKVNISTGGVMTDSYIHRILSNEKEELISNNELIQDCG